MRNCSPARRTIAVSSVVWSIGLPSAARAGDAIGAQDPALGALAADPPRSAAPRSTRRPCRCRTADAAAHTTRPSGRSRRTRTRRGCDRDTRARPRCPCASARHGSRRPHRPGCAWPDLAPPPRRARAPRPMRPRAIEASVRRPSPCGQPSVRDCASRDVDAGGVVSISSTTKTSRASMPSTGSPVASTAISVSVLPATR